MDNNADFNKNRNCRNVRPQEKLMYLSHRLTEETTAHGIPHIARANGFWRSLIWIIISLVMLVTWIYHSQYTISQYLKMEVNVKLEFKTAQNLPFPAMTVCNKNAFKNTQGMWLMERMIMRFNTPEGKNASYPPWLISYLKYLATFNGTDEPEAGTVQTSNPTQLGEEMMQLLYDSIIKYGPEYNLTVDDLTYSFKDFVLTCDYERTPCEKRGVKINRIFNWLHGHCYVLNAEKATLLSTQTGPRYGLKVALNIDQDEYWEVAEQAGVRVLIHDPDQMPFPEDDGYNIPPGLAASLGVRLVKQSRLGGSYTPCFNEKEQNEKHDIFRAHYGWTKYSLKTCMISCYQREVEARCQCSDIRYPAYKKGGGKCVSCTENMTMSFGAEMKTHNPNECLRFVQEMYRNQSLNCDKECLVPCSQNSYVSSVSYSGWPSTKSLETVTQNLKKIPSAAKLLDESIANIYKNFVEVTLYYEDFSYNAVSERPAIRLTECLSDLGGNMGMYVGASLFTFFEFFQYLIDVFLWSCVWCCKSLTRNGDGHLKELFAATKVRKIQVKPEH